MKNTILLLLILTFFAAPFVVFVDLWMIEFFQKKFDKPKSCQEISSVCWQAIKPLVWEELKEKYPDLSEEKMKKVWEIYTCQVLTK
ncbi:hypothetical protein J7L36_01835 [bacterium]|nr:hypothetical protein [bacterium]